MNWREFLKPTKAKAVALTIIFLLDLSFGLIIWYVQQLKRGSFEPAVSVLLIPLTVVALFSNIPGSLLPALFFSSVNAALTYPYNIVFDSIFLLLDFVWVYLVICTVYWLYARIRKRTESKMTKPARA